jgi:hypothetical protein
MKTAALRRNIPDGGADPSPEQQSHPRLVRWPWGPSLPYTRSSRSPHLRQYLMTEGPGVPRLTAHRRSLDIC